MKDGVMVLGMLLLVACHNSPQRAATTDTVRTVSDTLQKTSNSEAYSPPKTPQRKTPEKNTDTELAIQPVEPAVKNPSGFYQAILPYNDSLKMEQTVKFNDDHSFTLQEKILDGKKDSSIRTEGTWTPSDGFIWLYREQVVRGRYKWKGDSLQYFDPSEKRDYTMHVLKDMRSDESATNKKDQGIVLFGLGHEPSWTVSADNKDSISFMLQEWKNPLQLKITSKTQSKDTVIYLAQNDSLQLRLALLPCFCKDNQSDDVYDQKLLLQYHHKTYTGCGMLYR